MSGKHKLTLTYKMYFFFAFSEVSHQNMRNRTCIVLFNVKLQPKQTKAVHISTKYANSFLTKLLTPRQHFSKSLNDRNCQIYIFFKNPAYQTIPEPYGLIC